MSDSMTMTDEQRRLFSVFKQAIEDERRAQEVYREAMTITEDPRLLAVFRSLYEDEVRHEREMVQRYAEFRQHLPSASEE